MLGFLPRLSLQAAIMAIIPAICLMGTMKQTSQFFPITEAKNRLLHLIREIDEKDEVLTITRGGVPVAVMLSPERYKGLLETIELLADRAAMLSLVRSIEDSRAGRWVNEENEVFGEDQA